MLKHDFATHDVAEARLLSRISENLSRRETFAEYVTWLSAVDPETSVFARAYVEHAFDGSPIPAPAPHRSGAWHRMIGYSIGETGNSWYQNSREISEPARRVVESWVRPIVTMVAEETTVTDLPLGSSRFLGAPDLPEGFTWPTCGHGPLRFQAQIDLRELRHSVATQRYSLPEDGWLVLFAFDDDGEDGIQPGVIDRDSHGNFSEIPGLTHVAYIPASAKLVRFRVPAETVPWKGADLVCSVKFGESLDVPWAADTEDHELKNQDVADWMGNLRGGWVSKLMGYPMHGRTGNTSPGPDWLNLFTLGSDDTTEWSWCDGQDLDVYVHGDGLKSRSFCPFYGYAA